VDALYGAADRQQKRLAPVLDESAQIACPLDAEEVGDTSEKSVTLDGHIDILLRMEDAGPVRLPFVAVSCWLQQKPPVPG
jgi:hypothetical protein